VRHPRSEGVSATSSRLPLRSFLSLRRKGRAGFPRTTTFGNLGPPDEYVPLIIDARAPS
jgi:hypothetical protein